MQNGYKHLDLAWIYGNEQEVGQGIRDSGVPRDEIFITSKLWCTKHRDVEAAVKESLDLIGTNYLDLCTFPSFCGIKWSTDVFSCRHMPPQT